MLLNGDARRVKQETSFPPGNGEVSLSEYLRMTKKMGHGAKYLFVNLEMVTKGKGGN